MAFFDRQRGTALEHRSPYLFLVTTASSASSATSTSAALALDPLAKAAFLGGHRVDRRHTSAVIGLLRAVERGVVSVEELRRYDEDLRAWHEIDLFADAALNGSAGRGGG